MVTIADLRANLTLNDTLTAAMQRAVSAGVSGSKSIRAGFDTIADGAKKAGAALESAGQTLSTRVTAPLVAAGTAALTFSAQFQSAMTKAATLGGETTA